jgi:hypothetical protein
MKEKKIRKEGYSLKDVSETNRVKFRKGVAFLGNGEANPLGFFGGSTCFNFLRLPNIREKRTLKKNENGKALIIIKEK